MIITAASLLLSVLAESSGKIGASRFAGMSLDPFSGDGGGAGSHDRVTDFLCATRTLFRSTLSCRTLNLAALPLGSLSGGP